jgi:hypothetical protein
MLLNNIPSFVHLNTNYLEPPIMVMNFLSVPFIGRKIPNQIYVPIPTYSTL